MNDDTFARKRRSVIVQLENLIDGCSASTFGATRRAALIQAKQIVEDTLRHQRPQGRPLAIQLYEVVRDNPWIDPAEVAAITRKHPNTVRRELAFLWHEGKLKRIRTPRPDGGNGLHFCYALPAVPDLEMGESAEAGQDRRREEAWT